MSVDPAQNLERVQAWVKKAQGIQVKSVVRLPGDASTRIYYRVVGAAGKSWIVMQTDPFDKQGAKFPFLEVQHHLRAAGVDVPEVVESDPKAGRLLLEDLGDVTLLRRLQEVDSPDVERHLYEKVIDGLIQLQVFASPARAMAPVEGFKLKFDHEKLMWEVSFTIEHFYEKHLKRDLAAADRQVLMEGFGGICTLLAAQPMVFTHRDFHSRNIMVLPSADDPSTDRLAMIDFQDARMGQAQYDLASLLKDSYYQLAETQIDRLLDYYTSRWEAVTGERLEREQFRRVFDLMAVQRNFKAIGSFASFHNLRGIPTYLKYVGNTFENIRRTLLKYPEYSNLREVLFHYYYF